MQRLYIAIFISPLYLLVRKAGIIFTMSKRVSLIDLERKKSGSRAVYYIFFGLFFIVTLATIYHFFTQTSSIIPAKTIVATPTPFPGLFSPNQQYRALRINNQFQIFEGNSDKLVFKIFDRNGQYLPEKWADDSRSLVYKLELTDSSSFGLIYLNQNNVFVANPNAIAHNNCSFYSWAPDNKKIIFYGHISDSPCLGTLIEFNSKFSVRNLGINATKNSQTYQSVENAFWDSDSKKLNINLSIGKLNNGLDKNPRTETKIIGL